MTVSVARVLGYAGLVPFVAVAGAAAAVPEAAATALAAGRAYAAVILSFLGGFVWGRLLAPDAADHPAASRLLVYSVVPSLVAWAALLLPTAPGLWLLAAGLAGAWLHDRLATPTGLLPAWFLELRTHLTVVAGLAVLGMAVLA